MFMGEYHHNIDEKGRLIIPSKFRYELGEKFVITRGIEECLFVYSMEEWNKIIDKLKELPFTSKDARTFMRMFLSGATECELDKNGRVNIVNTLSSYAGILNESIENLNIKEDGIYVDCTLGFAGHSKEILKRIKKGKLFAFDQDGEAINYSKKILDQISGNYEIIKSNFAFIKSELNKRGIEKVDGVLFDLGVSSVQLDEAERGFSFHKDAKLDMRMDTDQSFSAYDVVNDYSKEELETIFFKYGEEKYSRSIASAIVRERENKKIETTLELTEIIRESVPEKYRRTHHPARKVFQAIRIEVNKELDVFTKALNDAIDMLNPGGRICVITFHSLEDRICKNIFKEKSEMDSIFKGLPDKDIPLEYRPELKLIAKIKPSKKELEDNNRSRSSILRVAEKM